MLSYSGFPQNRGGRRGERNNFRGRGRSNKGNYGNFNGGSRGGFNGNFFGNMVGFTNYGDSPLNHGSAERWNWGENANVGISSSQQHPPYDPNQPGFNPHPYNQHTNNSVQHGNVTGYSAFGPDHFSTWASTNQYWPGYVPQLGNFKRLSHGYQIQKQLLI